MEKIERLEKLLQGYSYAELSATDKEEIQEFVSSEEEYEALRETNKQLFFNAEHKLDFVPSPAILKKIKVSNRAMRKPLWSGAWLQSPMPSYATLMIAIFVGSLAWWGGSHWTPKLVSVEKFNLKIDTVYLTSKPDTIVREKIVYVNAEANGDQVTQLSAKQNQQDAIVTRGVSMKEKEELGKLLVSGSY
jgi:hypothetical protein